MRVLLIAPPSPERLETPLLGIQYVAASLLACGCEVRVIDAAARAFLQTSEWIASEARRFAPDIVAFSLFTRWVRHAYTLAGQLRGCAPVMVAGGPHATVCPEEALHHGFDIVVLGEAERTMPQLLEWREGLIELDAIPGIRFRRPDGAVGHGPPGNLVRDLDSLPFPMLAQDLFEPQWYGKSAADAVPRGLLTSRGCPARCTFCANAVTGRVFRYRSAAGVLA
jgi:radical SAM superfamily enzyme YgiQ (UPF0313 family)